MLIMLMSMAETPEDKIKVEALYNKYDRLMYYVAGKILDSHEDIEDAVMEAWIRIIRNLDKISEISCPKTKSYIVIIVERTSIDIYKKKSKTKKRELKIENLEQTPILATSDKKMDNIEILDLFRQLPKKYSDPLILHYMHELPPSEIAKILKISVDLVYKRLQRGRKMLERMWQQ